VTIKTVVILGGYGNFGKRIAESLARLPDTKIILTGRNLGKAQELTKQLLKSISGSIVEAAQLDIYATDFKKQLSNLNPFITIHTGGPFQGQDFRVPEACIQCGSHYIDLADDRRYVCDITQLNEQAIKNNVLIVSGASSVPGLSSTVIDHYQNEFADLTHIDFAIAPGNKAERGEATVKGILSYTGHPFPVFENGEWKQKYGWMSPRKMYFNDTIGTRCLANIDIPDLELFPKRYPACQSVAFQAGLELPFLHYGMIFMALLAKFKLVKDWSKYTGLIFNSSEIFKKFGTDIGGMFILLTGKDNKQQPISLKWVLDAKDGIGPYIPTLSAIIIAKKLLAGEINQIGATPCLGLYTLNEFDKEALPLGITHKCEINNG